MQALVVPLALLWGCGAAAEPVSALDNFIAALQEGDTRKALSFVSSEVNRVDDNPLDAFRVMQPRWAEAAFARFSRDVKDVEVRGDRAVLRVDITNADVRYVTPRITAPLTAMRLSGTDVTEGMIIDAFVAAITAEDTPTVTVPVTVRVVREDGTWKIAGGNDAFFTALLEPR